MDFVRQTITNGETVIDKALLDAFQDGVEEGIGKAEQALSIYNVPTLGTVERNKFLNAKGEEYETGNSSWCLITADVIPNMPYHIKASGRYNYCMYAIYDAAGTVLIKEQANPNEDVYRGIEKMIVMPSNAASIKVAYINKIEYGKAMTKGHIWFGAFSPIMKYVGKKWVCVGDSLTERNERTDLNYHDYIAAELGLTVYNMGVSGSGYKNEEDVNCAFYQRVANVPTDADIVTIMGSSNDGGYMDTALGTTTDTGTDTLCGCINTTIDTLITMFTNAGKVLRLGIITMPPTRLSKTTPEKYDAYNNAIIEICKNKGVPCLDLYRCSNLHPETEEYRQLAFSRDVESSAGGLAGVHPDETGHLIISSPIRQFVESLL